MLNFGEGSSTPLIIPSFLTYNICLAISVAQKTSQPNQPAKMIACINRAQLWGL